MRLGIFELVVVAILTAAAGMVVYHLLGPIIQEHFWKIIAGAIFLGAGTYMWRYLLTGRIDP